MLATKIVFMERAAAFLFGCMGVACPRLGRHQDRKRLRLLEKGKILAKLIFRKY
jgi:hypothetical protein